MGQLSYKRYSDFIVEFENVIPETACQKLVNMYEKHQAATIEKSKKTGTYEGKTAYMELAGDLMRQPDTATFFNKQINAIFNGYQNVLNLPDPLESPKRPFTLQYKVYRADEGHNFDIHCDAGAEYPTRYLTIIFYLNECVGGGTEFPIQGVYVEPSAGSAIVFPSDWTHPHRGNSPKSGSKYFLVTFLNYDTDAAIAAKNI